MKSTKVICNDGGEAVIKFGEVIRPGNDLPSVHNLAKYVDSGRLKLIDFFDDHKLQFTYLSMEGEKRGTYTLSKTYCEHFFNIYRYLLLPKWARIGVRKYEETAMLYQIMQFM